jgi:hypothetical protein
MNLADRARSTFEVLRAGTAGRFLDLVRATPLDSVVGAGALLVSLYYGYVRLRYGVHLHDEAFYAVITQRFALGDRPYVDEINLRQGASVLTVPLYWLYLKLAGSTDGVIHFLRQVYFALLCLLSLAVYRLARPHVRLGSALLAASLPVTFVPFAVPTCSYNNLGAVFFALGTCLGLRALLAGGPAWSLALAGAVHGLACISYPPLGLPVALLAATTPLVVPREGPLRPGRALLAYVGGLALVGGVYLAFFGRAIWIGSREAFAYEEMLTRPRTFDKLKGVLEAMNRLSPAYPATLASLAAAWLLARHHRKTRPFLVPVLIVPVLWWFSEARPEFGGWVPLHTMTIHVVLYLGLLSGFFLLLVPERRSATTFLVWGWLPAVLAGITMAVSSDNGGCMNAGLGLFSAAVLCPIAAAMAGETRKESGGAADGMKPVLLVPGVLGLLVMPVQLLRLNYQSTYHGGPVETMTAQVRVGPFRGLWGNPRHISQAELLSQEIPPLHKPGERMLAYYTVPAAYLTVQTRPALPTSWTDIRAKGARYLPYYQQHRTGNGLVIVTSEQGQSPELERLTQDPKRLLKNLGWIRIYREPPP